MTKRKPAWQQSYMFRTIPQMIVFGIVMILSSLAALQTDNQVTRILCFVIGSAAYLTYSFGSRWILLRHSRMAESLRKRGQYSAAIEAYEKSYVFFSRNPWIDRYRQLTMLTPVAYGMREAALINIGYCYGLLGNKQRMKEYYQRAAREFPESSTASDVLQLIETMESEG